MYQWLKQVENQTPCLEKFSYSNRRIGSITGKSLPEPVDLDLEQNLPDSRAETTGKKQENIQFTIWNWEGDTEGLDHQFCATEYTSLLTAFCAQEAFL